MNKLMKWALGIKEEPILGKFYCLSCTLNFDTDADLDKHNRERHQT